jgi:hypothetical protein
MPTLPTPGGDSGTWGDELNEWLEAANPVFNVKLDPYNAVGDGVTDDTAAIQAAIDAASGGSVFLPAGQYVITTTLTVSERTSIAGVGYESQILHTGNNVCFSVETGNPGYHDARATLQGFRITGSSGASAIGVEIVDSSHTILRDLRIDDYSGGAGLRLRNEAEFCENTVVDNVHFYNNAYGIRFHRSAGGDASFSYQRFTDFKMNVFANQIGVDWGGDGSTGGFVFGSEFSGNVWLNGDDSFAYVIRAGFTVDRCRVYLRAEDLGYTNAYGIANSGTLDATGTYRSVGTISESIGTGYVKPADNIWRGAGSPEGVVTADVGSLFLRTDGSTSTTLYVKTSGSGDTGWTAK